MKRPIVRTLDQSGRSSTAHSTARLSSHITAIGA